MSQEFDTLYADIRTLLDKIGSDFEPELQARIVNVLNALRQHQECLLFD